MSRPDDGGKENGQDRRLAAENQNRSLEPRLDCNGDPAGALKQMFVDLTMRPRLARGQDPAKRPVFLKPHGTARGSFQVRAQLLAELKTGIFREPKEFPVWIRFSSDTT